MRRARWAVLLFYVLAIFLSLPWTPTLVRWSRARFGAGALPAALACVFAAVAAVFLRRLAQTRHRFPWPHLALVALAAGGALSSLELASSPVGRVHLPEYGLLAVLAARALGGGVRAALGGGALAAGIGFVDELVQAVTPGRVFDWWDVALNAAAALLGALACAWWRWTAVEGA